MIRDAVCSRYFGAAVLHYFYIAFFIPNLFRRLFGEGALTAAFIPVYTEQRHHDPVRARRFAQTVVTLLFLVLAGITLIGTTILFALVHWLPSLSEKAVLTLHLTMIMLPYMILICMVALIGGILNVHQRFGSPAASPIILNLCIIAGVLVFAKYFGVTGWSQIYSAAVAVLIAGCLQLAVQLPFLRREGISLRPNFHFRDEAVKRMMHLMAPMMVGLAAVQINTLFDSLIAMVLSATEESGPTFTIAAMTVRYPVFEGSIAFLYNAQRLYQIPLGVFGIALATAIFPVLSRHAVKKDLDAFSRTFNEGLRLVIFISIPATIALILICLPLVQAIFEGGQFTASDSLHTAVTLLFYSIGIGAYILQQLVVRAFYSFQDSTTPVKIAMRMVVLNFILNLILIWPLGTGGLALSTALCATIQVAVLIRIMIKRYGLSLSDDCWLCYHKTLIASLGMAAICFITLYLLDDERPVVQLMVAVPVSAGTFIGLAAVLKIPELHAVWPRKSSCYST